MSFFSSFGKVFKKIASPVLKTVGMVVGGSAGATLGGAIGSAISAPRYNYEDYSYKRQEDYARRNIDPIPMFPGAGGGAMSSLPYVARAAGAAIGIIRGVGGKILKIVMPSGKSVTRRKAASLIKRVGLEAGAAALGIGVIEAAQLLLDDQSSPRRRRGITGAQLSNAKRVVCTINTMHKQLGCGSRAPARRRAASCR